MECPGAKASSGSSPFHVPPSPPTPIHSPVCQTDCSGSGGRKRLEQEASNTGKSAWLSARKLLFHPSSKSFQSATQNCQEATLQQNMFGKKKPVSKEHSSNMVQNHFKETKKLTGKQCGLLLNEVMSTKFRHQYEWSVTGPFEQLVQTTTVLDQLFELAMCSGVQQVLESPELLGNKQAWRLIVKTPEVNSGVDIKVNFTLLSMNFVEASIFHTYSDGLIVTRYGWKSKDQVVRSKQRPSGSHQISTQESGTQRLTIKRPLPCSDAFK